MAMDRPEATDAAPLRAEASAEDGEEAAFLSREEWAIRGPMRLGPRGVVSQGKKVATRRCGIGGRGDSRPSAKSRNRRGRSDAGNGRKRTRDRGDLCRIQKRGVADPGIWQPSPASGHTMWAIVRLGHRPTYGMAPPLFAAITKAMVRDQFMRQFLRRTPTSFQMRPKCRNKVRPGPLCQSAAPAT